MMESFLPASLLGLEITRLRHLVTNSGAAFVQNPHPDRDRGLSVWLVWESSDLRRGYFERTLRRHFRLAGVGSGRMAAQLYTRLKMLMESSNVLTLFLIHSIFIHVYRRR